MLSCLTHLQNVVPLGAWVSRGTCKELHQLRAHVDRILHCWHLVLAGAQPNCSTGDPARFASDGRPPTEQSDVSHVCRVSNSCPVHADSPLVTETGQVHRTAPYWVGAPDVSRPVLSAWLAPPGYWVRKHPRLHGTRPGAARPSAAGKLSRTGLHHGPGPQ